MKVKLSRITPPIMPSEKRIDRFCRSLSDDKDEIALLGCCISLSLAIAPDNERSFYTAYGYACHFADGFTQSTLEAVRMWTSGKLRCDTQCDIPDVILDNFKGAYLFRWQKRLIGYALSRYDLIKEKAAEVCPSCCTRLSEYALRHTLLTESM